MLGTQDPEMTKTQLRHHWGEGLHKPVTTNSNYCWGGKGDNEGVADREKSAGEILT